MCVMQISVFQIVEDGTKILPPIDNSKGKVYLTSKKLSESMGSYANLGKLRKVYGMKYSVIHMVSLKVDIQIFLITVIIIELKMFVLRSDWYTKGSSSFFIVTYDVLLLYVLLDKNILSSERIE